MRGSRLTTLAAVLVGPLLLVCSALVIPVHGQDGETKTPSDSKPPEKRFTPSGPSIIPHPVYDIPCLTCHKTERSVATRIPHPPYPHCLQCHIVQVDVKPYRKNLFAELLKQKGKVPVPPPPAKSKPEAEKKPQPPPAKKNPSGAANRVGKPTPAAKNGASRP